jgi:hypothetical protein
MWPRLRRVKEQMSEGQGLVELAITLPILLIMFLGLIELSLALRAQLVLVNANREAARLAARGTFTDKQIARQALVSFGQQLPATTLGLHPNTGIIITRFHIPEDPAREAYYYHPIYTTGTLTYTSRIDPDTELIALRSQNNAFNNDLVSAHEDAVRTVHDVVFVEIFYYHHQVLHAPLVEWIFPEPMVLYSRTMMRVGAARAD